jgi:hypothetical protein
MTQLKLLPTGAWYPSHLKVVSSKCMADLLDGEDDIIDEKRVSLDFANFVVERAKSNSLKLIERITTIDNAKNEQ